MDSTAGINVFYQGALCDTRLFMNFKHPLVLVFLVASFFIFNTKNFAKTRTVKLDSIEKKGKNRAVSKLKDSKVGRLIFARHSSEDLKKMSTMQFKRATFGRRRISDTLGVTLVLTLMAEGGARFLGYDGGFYNWFAPLTATGYFFYFPKLDSNYDPYGDKRTHNNHIAIAEKKETIFQ